MQQVSVLLVGTGGYGAHYLKALLDDNKRPGEVKLVGAVEVNPAAIAILKDRGVPVYGSVEEFYESNQADLAVISSPIFLHFSQAKYCHEKGSNVLCEKPLCTSMSDALELSRMSKEGPFIFVGYQLSFSRVIRRIKSEIANGDFGKPITFKSMVYYSRGQDYYARNGWAGKKRMGGGQLVLDSPMHNAVAHHLNIMLFLLGDAPDRAAEPATLQAELYRAHPVENYDTVAIRCVTDPGVQVLYYTSHSLNRPKNIGPVNSFRFEKATIFHDSAENHEAFTVMFDDGRTRQYSSLYETDYMQKLWDCVDAVLGGPAPHSSVDAAIPEVMCVNGAELSHPITTFPESMITWYGEQGSKKLEVDGLLDTFQNCFDNCKLPSESGAPWAVPGKIVTRDEIMALIK